jgi:hypothetical protein
MKIIEVLTTSILFLLPGVIAPAFAMGQHEQEKQPEQKQQARPAQQPQRAAQQKQAKPAQQPQRAAQQKQAKPAQEPQRAAQQKQSKPTQQRAAQQKQAKPAQQPQRAAQQRQSKPTQQRAAEQKQAKPAQQPQRAAQQANRGHSAGGRGSIPEARFNSSFGRSHTFHVNRGEFANGPGRFQYGGYWFNTVDPWPVGWLYTDNVYVDYLNGGYFLCDPLHPGVYISINIG